MFLSNIYLKVIPLFSNIYLFRKHSSFPTRTPPASMPNLSEQGIFSTPQRATHLCLELPTPSALSTGLNTACMFFVDVF